MVTEHGLDGRVVINRRVSQNVGVFGLLVVEFIMYR